MRRRRTEEEEEEDDIWKRFAEWELDNSKPCPQELIDDHEEDKRINRERSYLMPFNLAALLVPEVASRVGVTIETVPTGTIDLSVNTPDQLLHGH